ncbi:hypothetical protein ACKFKG_15450 [Phormidesmis sp. 146-35]
MNDRTALIALVRERDESHSDQDASDETGSYDQGFLIPDSTLLMRKLPDSQRWSHYLLEKMVRDSVAQFNLCSPQNSRD